MADASRVRRQRVAMLVWAGFLAGCAIRSEDPEPQPVAVVVSFPSLAAALQMDFLDVRVFAGISCATLMQQRAAGAEPVAVAQTGWQQLCNVRDGLIKVDAPVGAHALLGVAARDTNRVEYYAGCVEQTLGTGDAPLPITLSRSNDLSAALPPTECTTFDDLCAQRCE